MDGAIGLDSIIGLVRGTPEVRQSVTARTPPTGRHAPPGCRDAPKRGAVKTRVDSAGTAKRADSRGRFATRPKHGSDSGGHLAVEMMVESDLQITGVKSGSEIVPQLEAISGVFCELRKPDAEMVETARFRGGVAKKDALQCTRNEETGKGRATTPPGRVSRSAPADP